MAYALHKASNNETEYEALIAALRIAKVLWIQMVHSDSQLVVWQVSGKFEARESRMQQYLAMAKALSQGFEVLRVVHIPYEENRQADFLSWVASADFRDLATLVEVLESPSTDLQVVAASQELQPGWWMVPIRAYWSRGSYQKIFWKLGKSSSGPTGICYTKVLCSRKVSRSLSFVEVP